MYHFASDLHRYRYLRDAGLVAWRWCRNALAWCPSLLDRGSRRHCRRMAGHDVVRAPALLRVWVSACPACCFGGSHTTVLTETAQLGDIPYRWRQPRGKEYVYMPLAPAVSPHQAPSPAMYQYYQVMICLLKFDFFAFIGVTMQVSSSIGRLLMHLSLKSLSLCSFSSWCLQRAQQNSASLSQPFL